MEFMRHRSEAPLSSWSSLEVNRTQRSEGCRHFAPVAAVARTVATVKVTSRVPAMLEGGESVLALIVLYGENDGTPRTLMGVLFSDGTFVGQADEGHPYVVKDGRHSFLLNMHGFYSTSRDLLDKVAALRQAPKILDIAPPTPKKLTLPFNPQGLPTSVIYAVRTDDPDPSRSLMFCFT
jgi:cytosine/adenosine deaminase-related metal-dependent hydrolase